MEDIENKFVIVVLVSINYGHGLELHELELK